MKVLIDTTFYFPRSGWVSRREVYDSINYFRDLEVYYTEVSLLEAIWKAIKVMPPEGLYAIKEGIDAIRDTYLQAIPNGDSIALALKLYEEGYCDLIDNILYAVAIEKELFFLTIDKKFIDFLEAKGKDLSNVVTPSKLIAMIEGRKSQH